MYDGEVKSFIFFKFSPSSVFISETGFISACFTSWIRNNASTIKRMWKQKNKYFNCQWPRSLSCLFCMAPGEKADGGDGADQAGEGESGPALS